MQNEIQIASDLKEQLDHYRPIKPELELRIMQKFKLDWNYHSNNIEGNTLTYGETKALLLHGITAQGKPLKDHFEIQGHNEVIEWSMEIVKGDRPMTENFIRQFHEILLKEPYEVDAITPDGKPTKKMIKVGEYKTTPNHVKTKTGEIFYFASPEETPAKMNDLIQWYGEKKEKLHPVILAAELHYRFISIHPFDDGNGRVARLLMNFALMKTGYPPVIIKTEDKENYFSVLRQADAGIMEPFIKYITENLIQSLHLMIDGIEGKDIEESDDVLKELRILQAEIDSVADQKEKKRKAETMAIGQKVDAIMIPLLKTLDAKFVAEINKLLGGIVIYAKVIHYPFKSGGFKQEAVYVNIQEALAFLNYLKSNKANSIDLTFQWNSLKKLTDVKAVFTTNVIIRIDEKGVKITGKKNKDLNILIPNDETPTEEFNQVVKTLTKDIIGQIKEAMRPK